MTTNNELEKDLDTSFEFVENEIGKLNYEMYRKMVGGITWNGDKMKEYEEMPEKIRKAWEASGQECVKYMFVKNK